MDCSPPSLSVTSKIFREERKPGWKKKGEEAGEGAKGVALQTSPVTYRYPGITGLFPGLPEKGGLELSPTRNQNQNLSSLPRGGDQSPILSSGWGPFDQISASRTRGLEKQGRIGRVKERRQRGKEREINKVLFLTGRGTLASCPRQEETRDKRVPVAAAGSGPLAGKLAPEYPKWSGCQSWLFHQ